MINDTPFGSSQQIKQKIQAAYKAAVQNSFMSRSRSPGIDQLFRGVRLYGHDAGVDFAETHLSSIIQEALEEAGCKEPSLTLETYDFGVAAIAGMAAILRERTALKVETTRSAITLIWAVPNPGLI
ncbi:hypothetical protein [Hansschlegelia plantiphila]|uniref:Uncharacterized protein n=1 Tax=Hansschlegelia plantiphila TaxID=374655 RepID=A0A9W6MUP1_9HYPH|nr:hypothetical protein [Hansschlegelia plantiphila]GLK67031.1 hypothetical protein GCM10008179_06690 [Hansschlegelia plantiphila]